MDVNFFSMVYLYKHGLAHIRERKGHIVAVSSMMGKYSTQYRSGYAASKHALVGFMDSIRLELMADEVHVMTSIPGFVQTNVSLNALSADGSPHGTMDRTTGAGLAPDRVAHDILRGIEKRKREVISSQFKERFALFLSKWAPGLLDRILLKADVI